MTAYRSSVQESTGYTTQFLVFIQKLSLPLDCMYPNPQEIKTTDIHELVHNKQQAFQRAFELVRHNFNEKQKRPNAIYNKKIQGPTYKEGQKFYSIIQPSPLEERHKSQALGRDHMSLKDV